MTTKPNIINNSKSTYNYLQTHIEFEVDLSNDSSGIFKFVAVDDFSQTGEMYEPYVLLSIPIPKDTDYLLTAIRSAMISSNIFTWRAINGTIELLHKRIDHIQKTIQKLRGLTNVSK